MTLASNLAVGGKAKRFLPFAALAKSTLAAAALAVLLLLCSCKRTTAVGAAPLEDLSYASQVTFSDLHLSAAENFLGQQVVYLDGEITNRGSKAVRQLKVRMFFHDLMNQVVLREEQELWGERSDHLGAGQARSFQVRFDQVPDAWNRQVPELQIVHLQVQ
jgi:hypothetical protein